MSPLLHHPSIGNEPTLELEQRFIRERILYATKKDKKLIKMLHRFRLASNDTAKATELFNEFDVDHSGGQLEIDMISLFNIYYYAIPILSFYNVIISLYFTNMPLICH